MLNPKIPAVTPLVGETTSSLRRKEKQRTPFEIPPSAEVVDVESFTPLPTSFRGTTKSNAISVDHYDAVFIRLSDSDSDSDHDDVVRIVKTNNFNGETSNSNAPPFVCEICTETKAASDAFGISGCCHVYCKSCIALYVKSKLDENVVRIGCPVPRCSGLLEMENCGAILPSEALDRWGKALREAVMSSDEKLYCPLADCSALLIREGEDCVDVRECECPNCRRMFCVVCRVPWHAEISCQEFQKLNAGERGREDVMFINLAKQMQWIRCPKCGFYVSKSEGCNTLKCRCGTLFCYGCGVTHDSLNHSHRCLKKTKMFC